MTTNKIDWKKAHQGMKIMLDKTMVLESFNKEPRKVESGIYYITGFWCDIVGLSKISSNDLNDVCIRYKQLSKFNTI